MGHDFERTTLIIKLERTGRVKRSIENTYPVIDSNDGKRIGSFRSNNFLLVIRSNESPTDRAKGHKSVERDNDATTTRQRRGRERAFGLDDISSTRSVTRSRITRHVLRWLPSESRRGSSQINARNNRFELGPPRIHANHSPRLGEFSSLEERTD